jgi:hypothetical protein
MRRVHRHLVLLLLVMPPHGRGPDGEEVRRALKPVGSPALQAAAAHAAAASFFPVADCGTQVSMKIPTV